MQKKVKKTTYSVKQASEICGLSEHTLRYYTDQNLIPCQRDSANRRVFDEASLKWIHGIKCLRRCGVSIEDVKKYCELCYKGDDTIRERYEFILKQRKLAYQRLQEAMEMAEYMDTKVKHFEDILYGKAEDTANLAAYTSDEE